MNRPPSSFLRRRLVAAPIGLLLSAPAWSQFRVEVAGVGLTQLPVVVPAFRGEGAAPQKM